VRSEDVLQLTWRKSSFSQLEGNCVEVAALDDGRIAVRNSRHPDEGIVFFARAAMDAWVTGAKAGQFDNLG
jgi:hypothetical protein